MAVHVLKTWPDYWWAVGEDGKNFEVRRDDRGFEKGDILHLICFDPKLGKYMRDSRNAANGPSDALLLERRITWILTGGQMGVEPGYVVMGLAHTEDD